MKYVVFALAGVGVIALIGVIYTWFTPYPLGYDGEVAVGFYRMQVVQYDITDYGGRNTVTVRETLGGLDALWQRLTQGNPRQ